MSLEKIIKDLIKKGNKNGYVSYDDITRVAPFDSDDFKQIEKEFIRK